MATTSYRAVPLQVETIHRGKRSQKGYDKTFNQHNNELIHKMGLEKGIFLRWSHVKGKFFS